MLPLINPSNQGRALLLGYLAFGAIYLGSAAIAVGETHQLQMSAFERGIPLLDGSVWIYLSQFLLLPTAILRARNDRNRSQTFYSMLLATVFAAGIFILWPTQLDRPVPSPAGLTGLAWSMLYLADIPRNCFPSLHVALAIIAAMALWYRKDRLLAVLWPGLIVVSTLTTKQHIVWDIAGGMALAPLAWIVTRKFIRHEYPK